MVVEQVPGVLRRADVQDEQGDGDAEDRVAEEDKPHLPNRARQASPARGLLARQTPV
jgi:hypothetical protein